MCSSAGSAGRICLQGPSGSSDAAYQHAQPQMISAKATTPSEWQLAAEVRQASPALKYTCCKGLRAASSASMMFLCIPTLTSVSDRLSPAQSRGAYCAAASIDLQAAVGRARSGTCTREGSRVGPSARAAARSPYPGGDTPIKAVALLQCTSAKGFLYPCAEKRSAPTAYTLAVKQACQYCAQGQPQSIQVHRLYRAGWIRTMHARPVPAQTPQGGTSATA